LAHILNTPPNAAQARAYAVDQGVLREYLHTGQRDHCGSGQQGKGAISVGGDVYISRFLLSVERMSPRLEVAEEPPRMVPPDGLCRSTVLMSCATR
jgi:hypothetical protein